MSGGSAATFCSTRSAIPSRWQRPSDGVPHPSRAGAGRVGINTESGLLRSLVPVPTCVGSAVRSAEWPRVGEACGAHSRCIGPRRGRQRAGAAFGDGIVEALGVHLGEVRRLHEKDLAAGYGRVVLPDALSVKYPEAAADWRWQFVFPAGRICRDPRWGAPSRYHLHESVVQRAVADAARRAGLTKRVSCHVFRHHALPLIYSRTVRTFERCRSC